MLIKKSLDCSGLNYCTLHLAAILASAGYCVRATFVEERIVVQPPEQCALEMQTPLTRLTKCTHSALLLVCTADSGKNVFNMNSALGSGWVASWAYCCGLSIQLQAL